MGGRKEGRKREGERGSEGERGDGGGHREPTKLSTEH